MDLGKWFIVILGGFMVANWYTRAAIVLFLVLLFRFIADLPNNPATPAVRGKEFVDILIVAVTVIVVAIPGTYS